MELECEWRRWHAHTFDPVARGGTARSAAPARVVLAGAQNADQKSVGFLSPFPPLHLTPVSIRSSPPSSGVYHENVSGKVYSQPPAPLRCASPAGSPAPR